MKIYKIIANNEPVTCRSSNPHMRMRTYAMAVNEYQARLVFHLDYSTSQWEIETITEVTSLIFGASSWEREE